MPTPSQMELWTNAIVRDCLLCCGGDIGAGLAAAELILSTQPVPTEIKPSISAFFAYDIHNRHAQGILNRTLKAAKGLTDKARKDLAVALKDSATDSGQAILEFIDKYRLQLAKLLTTTQLASLLEGAREVSAKVPALEEDAEALGPTPQPTFPRQDGIHLVTIEEAAKQLGEKNVLTREAFDALEAAARAKAFTVAGVDASDTLEKIRDVLAKNVKEGADYDTFKSQVMAAVDEGTFLSDAHTETVFRTNVQGAFSDGQMVVLQNPLVRSGFPYSAYDSIHDDRVRAEHLSLDKHGIDGSNVYRTDDPVFQTFRPPWDYNCRCSWTVMTVRQAAEAGVKEAKEWLDTGVEPSPPHFVAMPPFEPPPGFQRALTSAPLSIRLSLQPMTTFSTDPQGHEHKGKGKGGGQFVSTGGSVVHSGQTEVKDSGTHVNAHHITKRRITIQGIGDVDTTGPTALIEAFRDKNKRQFTLTKAHADEELRGRDLPRFLIAHIADVANKQKLPLRTTGVFSPAGKQMMEKMVRDGYATALPNGDYEFNLEKLIQDYKLPSGAFSIKEGDKPEEETDTALLYGASEGAGPTTMAALDTAKEPSARKPVHGKRGKGKSSKARRRLFKRLHVKRKWAPSTTLSTEPTTKLDVYLGGQPRRTGSNGQWITIGGQPDSSTGEKHVGGFRVFIDPNGNILKGRMRGKNVKDVKSAFDQKKGKASGGQQGRNVRGTGTSPFRRHESVGSPVANPPTGPGDATTGQRRQGKNKPVGPEAAGDTTIERVNRRIDRFANLFQTKGQTQAVEWLKEFKEQINTLGADQALAALGDAKTNLAAPKNVQYEGAYDELAEVKSEVDFIEGYLKRAGISLVQTGSTLDPTAPVISSFSEKNLKALERNVPEAPGNYVPTDQTFENKLEEAKHLPGLESSEDIDKVIGSKVTAFTPEVVAKLDARYGKGKWIVKSYGAEAYAGFGVFFPQKVAQIQRDAKATITEAKKGLKQNGFALFRGEDNKITGVTNGKQVFGFGTEEYNKLNKKIKNLVKQVSQAAPSEAGARLPMSPEQELKEGYFGISLVRNTDGIPIAVSDRDGKTYPFGSDAFKKLEETDGGSTGYAIHRAVETDEWRRQGFQADAKFMAQPAFEAVGVKDADRALGLTWETAKEGRVHVTTRGGKAAAIPYATLVGRGDDLPATFASEDSRAMEKAVEDAINQLPESERTGQLYAPDVVKTKDGWKVIELNPSAEGGGSDWLGRNPFVIDALVSHMTGREPMHVQFIRRLLAGRGIKAQKPPTDPAQQASLSTDAEGHEHKGKGKGGGQFISKGDSGDESPKKEETQGFRPKVYVKNNPSTYGKKQYDIRSTSGAPVRGVPISPDDERIPDTVYHMTTNLSAVTSSGYLRASGEGGLGGDKNDQIVSMTISKKIAEQIVADTKFVVNLLHKHGTAPPIKWDDAKSKWDYGERPTWGKELVNSLAAKAKEEGFSYEPIGLQTDSYGFGDHLTQYFTLRESKTDKLDPQFWDAEKMHTIDPNNVGLISIPKSHLKTGAMLTDFDLDNRYGLKEIRLYGDVPLRDNKSSEDAALAFIEEQHPRKRKGQEGGGQFVKGGSTGAVKTVKLGNIKARYSIHTDTRIKGTRIPLKNYKQQDNHTCGFVAALTLTRHLKSDVTPREVLKVIRPTMSSGIDGKRMKRALRELGIEATYRRDITVGMLRKYVAKGIPVLLTVYPEDWTSDHWTIVQGFDSNKIYLTNYKSLPVKVFISQWFDKGEGLVCKPLAERKTKGKPLAIGDTPPTVVSDTEILPALGAFPTEQNKPVTVDDLPKKIQVTTDWGRLRAVVVGRLDNDVLPAWYPSFDNPNGNEVSGPETAGQTKEEFDPKMFKRAVKQTEAMCSLLESEGVKVFRPNLVSPADAQADPIGLTSEWAREMFTVIGNKIIVNQPRAAHRNKDRDALTPLFLEIERAGKAQIVRPPATDWERRDDNLEDDPRPFIEGGDVFRFGNDVLVTMSYLATSPAGYRWLADELEPDGIKVWPAYLKPEWEHGDYVFFPVRQGLCISYLKGFKDGMLPVPCQDWQVVEITHDEADKGFAANGLVLRENVMMLPKGLPRVRRALEKKGVDVIEVPFDGPMFWQGGIDCATSELWRDA